MTLAQEVDRHLASSVESLARLYTREWRLVRDLARLGAVLGRAAEQVAGCGLEVTVPALPPHSQEFVAAASTALYRIQVATRSMELLTDIMI